MVEKGKSNVRAGLPFLRRFKVCVYFVQGFELNLIHEHSFATMMDIHLKLCNQAARLEDASLAVFALDTAEIILRHTG